MEQPSQPQVADLLRGVIAARAGGETRLQQERMAQAVAHAIAESRHLVVQAGTGVGKALDVDTPIPTPGGFVRMGDLTVGDWVFDPSGEPVRVIGAFDIRHDRPCYRVGFSDGSSLIADADHLWATLTPADTAPVGRAPGGGGGVATAVGVHTTVDLAATLRTDAGGWRHALPATGVAAHRDRPLPANPYVVGLGVAAAAARLVGPEVPPGYLDAGAAQRAALLAGLLDGGAHRAPQQPALLFASSGQRLARQVAQLGASLGVAPTVTGGRRGWQVRFATAGGPDRPGGDVRQVGRHQLLPAPRHVTSVTPVPTRPVRCVAVDSPQRLFLAGPTYLPTHNTIGYLVPALASGQRTVVSTATKQLGEQIVGQDLPALLEQLPAAGGPRFTYALLKGRHNYVCRARVHELVTLDEQAAPAGGDPADALFAALAPPTEARRRDDAHALTTLMAWVQDTRSGDRSEAPPVSDRVWAQVSTDAAGCPGASACPFGASCFSEAARRAARDADLVVTNHTQVAHDLRSPVPLLGDYQVLVTDEAHDLDSHLSSAWGEEVSCRGLRQRAALAARKLPRDPDGGPGDGHATRIAGDIDALADRLTALPAGRLVDLPDDLRGLLAALASKFTDLAHALERAAGAEAGPQLAAERRGAAGTAYRARDALTAVLDPGPEQVRWAEPAGDRTPATLRVAPLWVGPELMRLLGARTLVATSATATVNGSFAPIVRTLALAGQDGADPDRTSDPPRGFDTLDVGTPFDYDRQAILYVPPPGFPAPAGRDRDAHTAAVLEEVTALVRAAGGRTLALFTTRRAALAAAAHLRTQVATPVLAQGEAPPTQLLRAFADVEESTLCATMGFWHGVDTPGPSCTVVVMDKVPFAPADDPLMAARRDAADQAGRNGFTEVYVTAAAVMLAQGAGRLIRGATDRGVVAILDPRLRTKPYGAVLLRSLPPMRLFSDRAVVEAALTRLTGTRPNLAAAPTRRAVAPAASRPPDAPVQRPGPRGSRPDPARRRTPHPAAGAGSPLRAGPRLAEG